MRWNKVTDALPESGKKVIAYYKNRYGKQRCVMAFYAARNTIEQESDTDFFDYCEDEDMYFLPEGWHEMIDNWDVYSSIAISGDNVVTHWMDLPDYPEAE